MSEPDRPSSRPIDGFRAAIVFLTRVPIPAPRVVMAKIAPWFPVVGLLIGLVQGVVYVGLREVLPAPPAAVVTVAFGVLITGAFHHDGLADMADAFGGGWTVEQRMTILKDSRLGTYGTAALVLALATEISTVASLDPADGFRALVAAHTLSRAIAVGVMHLAPSAGDGLGAAYTADLSRGGTLAALAIGAAVTVTAFAPHPAVGAVVAIGAAVVAASAVVALAVSKIGGVTGDVLGAVQQMSALAVLLVAGAIAL